jgi:small subunit ribosomal protein S17
MPTTAAPAKGQNKTAGAPSSPTSTTITSMVGTVESDKRSKSRTVVVQRKTMHPKYGKYVARKTVLQVHDEKNESKLGDTVEVKPCRPISRTKNWTLVRIVERGSRVELVTQDPNAKA